MFWVFIVFILLIVILLIFFIGVESIENKVLYYPSKKSRWSPETSYDDIYINIKDKSDILSEKNRSVVEKEKSNKKKRYIHGWHFNNFPGKKTILFCHGNSGNISHRSYIIDIAEKFELNLFIFDYRGFGKSSSIPSKDNLKEDGLLAYDYLKNKNISSSDIIVWGESLGGFVAAWIASNRSCRSLILMSTFSALDDAVIYSYPESKSVEYIVKLASIKIDTIPSKEYLKKIKCPVAIVHSKNDDIIPYKCSKILYDHIPHQSKILITIDGKHSAPKIKYEDLNRLFMFCDLSLPMFDKHDVKEILKNLETVAETHHLFIDSA